MKKVCILGAGPAGLAAAYGLSATEALRAQYEVTVYQVGWRAGGKCATGRRDPGSHVEQNCAHYLFGCYDNTFAMVRRLYAELDAAGHPGFDDFDSLLLPRNLVALKQKFKGEWHTWLLEFPMNDAQPGDEGGEYLTASQYLVTAFEWLLEGVFGWKLVNKINNYRWAHRKAGHPDGWKAHHGFFGRMLHWLNGAVVRVMLSLARRRHPKRSWLDRFISWSLKRLRAFVWWLDKGKVDDDLGRLRKWSMFDYGVTMIIGVLDDRVLAPGGFEGIDHLDFRAWLKKHGATDYATDSPFVKLWYQNSLAYPGGNTDDPQMSAGISLLGQMYASNNYKGSVAFSLMHEIGDTFIGPMVRALRARGVKFNFFHRVRELVPGDDATTLGKVVIEQQVRLAGGDPAGYEPFVDVKGVQCWPDFPDASQFCEADRARYEAEGRPDLESFYTPWRGAHPDVVLERGRDFDHVIFAMPHSTLPFYGGELYEKHAAWQALVQAMPTVESQSLRLWFRPDLAGIGWPDPPPILSGYEMPYCTWEDDGQLVAGETWPEGDVPGAIACVFGPLKAPVESPGPDDHGYVARQEAVVAEQSDHFEKYQAGGLWSKVGYEAYPQGIDPALLVLKSARANIGPLQRYTMTWPGALKARMKVDGTGVDGLLFAGDWVRNGVEAGSIESATMAGLEASRAICGHPEVVLGEDISYG